MIYFNIKFIQFICIFSLNIILISSAFSSNNESSAGAVVGLFQPTYGKFATIASNASQPTFPTSMLMLGGDATFMRKGFFTGGRVLYGSTATSSVSTSASTYELTTLGLKSGYGFDLSFIDFKLGGLFGVGNLNFTSINSSQSGSIIVDYLFIEPFLMLGVSGGKNFKASMGGGYHYTFPYKVTTYGSTLISDPSQATVSGIMITFLLSFGDFGK
ncbi:hypothetical protein GCL60_07560 [Silvanigrella paludirubra]|uniref:Uncharacterized protein n=1 Tax=Silvanigrella paludirubra TaxID=2499159 RepID=A0A6N6VRI6_9BACT|nr:hypothetical protein [Silvanigrella paludirubra]KAB8038712.1 hypothetical protein GCL60_07560 [Silvanigrella paludirubra]